ncbi:MAG: hypothetical protein SFU56_07060 [Capsulimonadales bacterium]|nr:hypothetical protein [Capsulimonadales bacterium]
MATVIQQQSGPSEVTRPTPSLRFERGATVFVCLLFVLSGACGLGYEVVWAKFLGQFLGNTVLLHTAVLGAFVSGLALGSLAIGRRADRWAAPLKIYGFLEIAIAGYAIVFPTLSGLGQSVVYSAAKAMPPGSPALIAVKMLVGAALLALPTILMGATFPVLTAHVERSRRLALGANGANWLYFANCAGAVLGTLVTGFLLIPGVGLTGTVTGIALLNLVVGVAAVVAEKILPAEPIAPPEAANVVRLPGAPAAGTALTGQQRAVLIAICVSGATAFLYELVWTRLFAVTLGSSTYSFTLMLAAFITGLAGGSIVSGLAPTHRRPLVWFAVAEVLIGVVIALSVPLYPHLPHTFWQWKWLLRPNAESIGLYHLFQYGVIFSAMSLPTFLFGLTFPTAIKAASEENDGGSVAERAAMVYGWNTVGTLAGTLAAGCLLIPMLGLMRTLQIGAVINLGIGLFLLPIGPAIRRGLLFLAVPAAIILVATPVWDPALLTVGLFRHRDQRPIPWEEHRKLLADRKSVFYREDFGSTVAVVRAKEDTGKDQLTLVVDGKADASSVSDMPTQVLLAQLPLLFKPDARDVFVLGLGSGVTAGNVLTHPVDRVDCVELSPAVIDAARTFREANHDPFADRRFHLYEDDGKTFLASVNRQYDVIISEPTNPWIAGVGGLFTRETFEAQRDKLRPGGIVAQWFHSYELDDRLVATILRTFREVFPETLIFQGCSGDFIILGSLEPIRPDYAAMGERMRTPAVAATLTPIRISSIPALLAMQSHSTEAAQALTEGGGINSDDFPQLEYLAPHAFYVGEPVRRLAEMDGRFRKDGNLLLSEYRRQFPLTQNDEWSIVTLMDDVRIRKNELFPRVLLSYAERYPDDPRAALPTVQVLRAIGREAEALAQAERWAARGNAEAKTLAETIRNAIKEKRQNALID